MSLTRAAWLAVPFVAAGLAVLGGVALFGRDDGGGWTRNGRSVSASVISSARGCDGAVDFLTLGRALARRYGSPTRLEYYTSFAESRGPVPALAPACRGRRHRPPARRTPALDRPLQRGRGGLRRRGRADRALAARRLRLRLTSSA